jgi:hypothetical protein
MMVPLMNLFVKLLSCDVCCRLILARLPVGWHQSWLIVVGCQLELCNCEPWTVINVVASNVDLTFVCMYRVYEGNGT